MTAHQEGTCVHLACEIDTQAIHFTKFHFGQVHAIKMPGFEMLAFASIWGMMEIHAQTIQSQ